MKAKTYVKIVTKCWSNQIMTQIKKLIGMNPIFNVKVKNVQVTFRSYFEFPLISHNILVS